ncbi:Fungalysin metallopeptidase-domain-containing protein [Crassisporium funariophilum]|nr:Fungalysin metallopeptidase-domain-containing protein [Crassisporium funariophilum]
MAGFNRLIAYVLSAIVYLTVVSGSEKFTVEVKHSTHRFRHVSRELQLETFHPETTYEECFSQPSGQLGLELEVASRAQTDLNASTLAFVQQRLGIDTTSVGFRSGYVFGEEKYAYVKQYHNGIPFVNAVGNVAWKNGHVVSFGSSFVKAKCIPSSQPTVTASSIISKTESAFNGRYNGVPISLEYLARADGSVALVHVMQIQNEDINSWYEVYVDAHSGEILSATDFVADASYRAIPITKGSLLDGFETLIDPQNIDSSPAGWHTYGNNTFTTTEGNNVVAYRTTVNETTAQSSDGLIFDYTYATESDPPASVHSARVNAFYVINAMHDLAYLYGFTESAFNFQNDNYGKGGKDNDRVKILVQDARGNNNANFATPPDGISPICLMFIWTYTKPNRDGSLENDIMVHEMTHGITNRMTGGGSGRCLDTMEAGAMGEGWSDALAEWVQQKSADVADFVFADYVSGDPTGIRAYPYSTNSTTNPLRYSSLKTINDVHDIGEVWANLLHNVYAALVGQHGFSPEAITNASGPEGNIVYLHLLFDALRLQPCNPTFLTARTAWIQADENRYSGANRCLLWSSFASRGLGMNAENYNDDSTIPSDC